MQILADAGYWTHNFANRKNTVIIPNEGGYFGTVEYEITDIEMSDTNDVLDKIMNEITMLLQFNRPNVIGIIDKYRNENI